jgi:hypothetical protein
MKHTLAILSLACLLVTLNAANAADSQVKRNYPTPLAAEARATPVLFPEETQEAHWNAERTRHSVLIGMHDFAALDKEAATFMRDYSTHKINGDKFVDAMYSLVPVQSGTAQIEDLIAWTKASPKSYAAWYTLGRQYLELATDARGSKLASQTTAMQFNEAKRYADLAYTTLMKSIPLFAKPQPSYMGLISADALGGPYQFNLSKSEQATCSITEKFLGQCHISRHSVEDQILQALISADPDMTSGYRRYFNFNSTRWGGSMDHLADLYEQARKSGKMSQNNLAELHALLYWYQANELEFSGGDINAILDLYFKAYETHPTPANIRSLYDAAFAARKAGDKDRAIKIFSRIIDIRNTEYEALFNRAMLFDEVYQDHDRMFADLAIAAKMGYVYAQNNIGYDYMTGIHGYPVNLQEARKWLVLAANQGYQHSKDKIAVVDAMLAKQQAQEKTAQHK